MKFLKEEAITFDDILIVPQYSEIASRQDPDTHTRITDLFTPEFACPILPANMDSISEQDMIVALSQPGIDSFGILHRNMGFTEMEHHIKTIYERINDGNATFGVSVGVKKEELKRAEIAIKLGVRVICLDIAHAHAKSIRDMIVELNKLSKLDIIAGNVATYDGARFLYDCGVCTVKVGVGPGSICKTRIVTGHGVPQVTALMECSRAKFHNGQFLIADGGIKNSGDIVKALVWADAVMVGNLVAGTDEAPGKQVFGGSPGNMKVYRGMASKEAGMNKATPEGVSTTVPLKGPVKNVMADLMGGVSAGLSYSGAKNLKEFRAKAIVQRISSASMRESHPHILKS